MAVDLINTVAAPGTRAAGAALRAVIEALVDGAPVPAAAVADLNFFMQSAPASTTSS